MKRYLNYMYIPILLVALAGCSKQEETSIFGQAPEQRVSAVLKDYQTQLTAAKYGWKAVVFPTDSVNFNLGWGFAFKFEDQTHVKTYADALLDISDVADSVSSYQIKALQRPSLIFDTYSYLSKLSDPTRAGISGKGYSSDIEYSFISATKDTIRLQGNYNKTTAVFIRATEEEHKANQNNGILNTIIEFGNYENAAAAAKKQVKLITNQGDTLGCNYMFAISPKLLRTFGISYKDENGKSVSQKRTFAPMVNGIFLKTPIRYKDFMINEVLFDAIKKTPFVLWKGKRYDFILVP